MIVECGVEWSKIRFMLFKYLVIVWGESNGRTIHVANVKVSALVPLEGYRGLILLSGDPTIGIGKSSEHNRLPYHYDISVIIHTDRRTDM